jgi:hypothetical protein
MSITSSLRVLQEQGRAVLDQHDLLEIWQGLDDRVPVGAGRSGTASPTHPRLQSVKTDAPNHRMHSQRAAATGHRRTDRRRRGRGLIGAIRNPAGSKICAAADHLTRADRRRMANELPPLISMSPSQVDVVLRRVAGAAGRRTESAARQRGTGAGAGVASVAGGAAVRP